MSDEQTATMPTFSADQMEAGKVYKTAESELSYFAELVEKKDVIVVLNVYMPKKRSWKNMEAPLAYKVRELTDDEKAVVQVIKEGKAKARKTRAPKDPNAPPKVPKVKTVREDLKGKVSGLRMLACWAKHIGENIDKVGGKTLTINAMIAEFPHKEETIRKWVSSYKIYYNIGRLAKYGAPAKAEKNWVLSDEEKAALPPRNRKMTQEELNAAATPAA